MDRSIYRWVNRLADHTGWAHGIVRLYAGAGIAVFALLLLATFLEGRHTGPPDVVAGSVWAGAASLVAVGIGQIIGNAVDRPRPYSAMPDVHLLVHRSTDFSFPSDHATAAGAIAVGLFLVSRRWGSIAIAAAIAMAAARVYVGAHYPSDVLAGLALGGTVAVLGHLLVSPLLRRATGYLTGTPLRLLVSRPAR